MRKIQTVIVTGTMSGAAIESPRARYVRGSGRVAKRTASNRLL
jgi:hypothetical protein